MKNLSCGRRFIRNQFQTFLGGIYAKGIQDYPSLKLQNYPKIHLKGHWPISNNINLWGLFLLSTKSHLVYIKSIYNYKKLLLRFIPELIGFCYHSCNSIDQLYSYMKEGWLTFGTRPLSKRIISKTSSTTILYCEQRLILKVPEILLNPWLFCIPCILLIYIYVMYIENCYPIKNFKDY